MILLEPFPERRPLGLFGLDERLSKCLNFRGQRRASPFKGQANGLVVGDVANLYKKSSFPSYQNNSGSVSPGFLHHIMAFGIERRNIIQDNTDRDKFVRRRPHLGPFFLISAQALFSLRLLRMSF